MRCERAHLEFVSEGQGLTIGDCGLFSVGRIAIQAELAEIPERPCFLPPCPVVAGGFEGLAGKWNRIIQSAG